MFRTSSKLVQVMKYVFLLVLLGMFFQYPSKAQDDCNPYPIAAAWRPQGDIIAMAGTSCYGIQFFDETLEQLFSISLDTINVISDERINYIEWSPDSHFLAIPTYMDGVVIWDYESQSIYRTLDISPGRVNWSPNGQYLAFGGDIQPTDGAGVSYRDTIYVYDVLNDMYISELPDTDFVDEIYSPKWIDDETLYFLARYYGPSRDVYRWSLATNAVERVSMELSTGHNFSPNHWNVEDNSLFVALSPPDGVVGTFGIWYFEENRLVARRPESIEWATSSTNAHWSPDNQYILFGDNNYYAIFDPQTMQVVRREHYTDCPDALFSDFYHAVAWHPDGDRFVAASACGMQITSVDLP